MENLFGFDPRFAKNFSCPTCDLIEGMNILCVHIEEFLLLVRDIYIYIYDEKGMRRDLRRLGMVEMKGVLGFKKFLSVW